MKLRAGKVRSPVGEIFFTVSNGEREALCGLVFEQYREVLLKELERRYGEIELSNERDPAGVASRLRAYLDGELTALDDIPVETGGTPFQRAVWAALRRVPAGETRSYADLARAVGSPRAVRAVGAANGQNPVSLVVPCHRIIRSDGKLCGYGGGVERKRWLLVHEGALLA
ncbi:MAG TPA: methylated-DNA--[protein]-cysteine S-methyltransferase [Polyangia bacterium]|nr:methylated-DNA--[protein]-cysteine S-methyltransferase [Polyangia bacterium]